MKRFSDIPDSLIAACIHCGLCLDTCPTYITTGLEAESPRGRILLMEGLSRGRWNPTVATVAPINRCLGCLACETACPSGVQYGKILEFGRSAAAAVRPRSRLESWLVRHLLWRGPVLEKLARVYRMLGGNRWRSFLMRIPVPGLQNLQRLLPEVEDRPSPRASRPTGPPAVLVRGCVARAIFPETEASMVRLLEAAGFRVSVVGSVACCGALAAHAGEESLPQELAQNMVESLSRTQGPIIMTAAGCGAHVHHISRWVGKAELQRALEVEKRVQDLSVALENAPEQLQFQPCGESPLRVVYQDACHLQHGLRVTEAPRRWLERAGAQLQDVGEAALCCGGAGSYSIANPSMAQALGQRKAERLVETGTDLIITANPGCAMQLRAWVPEDLAVVTWAIFLEQHLGGTTWQSRK